MHLLANAVAIWTLGVDVVRRYGVKRFMGLYAFGAASSSLLHIAWQNTVEAQRTHNKNQVYSFYGQHLTRRANDVPALGASGAAMAIFAAYAVAFPHNRLMLLFFPLKARTAFILLVSLDLFSALSGASSGVSHLGHIGGALYGLAFALSLRRRGL